MSGFKQGLAVCVLAGGRGSRLAPLTESVPKPMVRIEGKPFLQILMEHFASLGYRRFVLAVGYPREQIREFFGDGRSFGWKVSYSVEPRPLGTGGAVSWAQPMWGDRAIVVNGDTYIAEDWRRLAAVHDASGLPATMAVVRADNCERFGRVRVEGNRVTDLKEKADVPGAGWINAGVYVVDSEVFACYPRGRSFSLERDVFPALAGRIGAFFCAGAFTDIGTPDVLQRFREHAATNSK